MRIVRIEPHGLCAGVNAAIAKALKLKDVYCLHALVHNEIVVDELRTLGFRFVESVDEVPEGATVVFSAHGVSPAVRKAAQERRLKIIDLTCPFVAKAHQVAREASMAGRKVIVLGERDHVEVKGILGEIDESAISSDECTVICQTTLNLDEAKHKVEELRNAHKIVEVSWPCEATKARQDAVRKFALGEREGESKAVLVLGSRSSANTKRLKAVAEECGVVAFMAGTMDEVRAVKDELESFDVIGVTSGASTPERFFMNTIRTLDNIPTHVAMIMDGNGRWATKRGKKRGEGHIAGAKTLTKVVEWCGARNIKYVTVYAFSTENWKRSKEEVGGLMKLFGAMMRSQKSHLMKNKVRFRVIGRRGDLSESLQRQIADLEAATRHFERQLIICISYGGRAEIVDAVNRAIEKGERVTEETFRNYLYAPDVPDPDLIIRTSGELRTSNFLLWESAYAEYVFTPTLWPDFSEVDLDQALADYAGRNRRKGAAQ